MMKPLWINAPWDPCLWYQCPVLSMPSMIGSNHGIENPWDDTLPNQQRVRTFIWVKEILVQI